MARRVRSPAAHHPEHTWVPPRGSPYDGDLAWRICHIPAPSDRSKPCVQWPSFCDIVVDRFGSHRHSCTLILLRSGSVVPIVVVSRRCPWSHTPLSTYTLSPSLLC